MFCETEVVHYPEKVIMGQNCIVFGYGQGDSGKHYTLFGENNTELEGSR